jgi:hypothetical protein
MADTITREQLLAEAEEILRTTPPRATRRHDSDENLRWLGRVGNFIDLWQPAKTKLFDEYLSQYHSVLANQSNEGFRKITVLLHRAQNELRMRTFGPTNIAISQGRVFEYFDEVRKWLELATEDVFFVDPYLDVDFVSRYLPNIQSGVGIRLLTSDKKLTTLLPAVDLFNQQHGQTVKVRSSSAGLHDRFLFLDKATCYLSGASFKDGAKNAGTTIVQITDGFSAMWQTYDTIWGAAKKERD